MSAADDERTKRMFVSALSSAMGLEQSYASQDGNAVNTTSQYQVIGPSGVGIEGKPISTAQPTVLGFPVGMLVIGALIVFFALKKG